MKKQTLTPKEQEIINAISAKISALQKEDYAIDMERRKGVTLERNELLGTRQLDIEAELCQLKKSKGKL